MQDYHTILAWRRAHTLAIQVRRATQRMPRKGYSDLKSQMTRAADSIAMNIVEGCAGESRKELARFVSIAIKSSTELQYQLELARSNHVLSHPQWEYCSRETIEIRKMLYAFRNTVLRADSAGKPTTRPGPELRTQPSTNPRAAMSHQNGEEQTVPTAD